MALSRLLCFATVLSAMSLLSFIMCCGGKENLQFFSSAEESLVPSSSSSYFYWEDAKVGATTTLNH